MLSPSQTAAGVPDFTVTVIGSGFVHGSTVLWNGESRDTGFLSPTVLIATVRAADVAQPGRAFVSVVNSGVGGAHSPTALVFDILNPVPAVESISPESVWAGGSSFRTASDGHRVSAGPPLSRSPEWM